MNYFRLSTLYIVLTLILIACTPAGEDAANAALGDQLQVIDPFGRAAPAVAETGAFYMVIRNGTQVDEVLQGVSIDRCSTVELHETSNAGAMMRMQPAAGGEIVIPAGQTVALQPGGLHVMCIGKEGELAVGDRVPLILNFLHAGSLTVEAEIREIAGGMQPDEMKGMGEGDGDS